MALYYSFSNLVSEVSMVSHYIYVMYTHGFMQGCKLNNPVVVLILYD